MLNINTSKSRLDLTQFGPMVMWYSVDSLNQNNEEELTYWGHMIDGPAFTRVAGSSQYPKFITNDRINHSTILVSGSNGIFRTQDAFPAFGSYTIFTIFNYHSTVAALFLISGISNGGLQAYINTDKNIHIGNGTADHWTSGSNFIYINKPYIFAFRMEIDSGNNNYKAYLNGQLVSSGAPVSSNAISSRAYYTASGAGFRCGTMSEIAVYTLPLSDIAIQTISADLMDYYGI